jgi:hypothetical protein
MSSVGSSRLGDAGEVFEQVATRLCQMLSVVHQVGWHHNLLLHHVVECNHRAARVPAPSTKRLQTKLLMRSHTYLRISTLNCGEQ